MRSPVFPSINGRPWGIRIWVGWRRWGCGVPGGWRGLGLALLQHTFRAYYQQGKDKVALGVDAESLTGATRLYEKAGMKVVPRDKYV